MIHCLNMTDVRNICKINSRFDNFTLFANHSKQMQVFGTDV